MKVLLVGDIVGKPGRKALYAVGRGVARIGRG